MSADDRLLLGIDLRKDARALERAYDDAQGVTARFNKNLLARINRELGGAFDLAGLDATARAWSTAAAASRSASCAARCEVRIAALDQSFRFARGDFIHTEGLGQVLGARDRRARRQARGCESMRAGSTPHAQFLRRPARPPGKRTPTQQRERPGAWNPGPPWEGDI
jgi:uncharacterized SAM-dependent methyltransferase